MIPTDDNFESKVSLESGYASTSDDLPFHILLLGDLSGNGDKPELSKRRPVVVDRDNFDEILQRFDVRLDLDLHQDGKSLISLRFGELDDFHPDRIFEQVSVFSDLRDIRRRLLKQDTFNEAAKEVRSWFPIDDDEAPIAEDASEPALTDDSSFGSGNLLDQILNKPNDIPLRKPAAHSNSELSELLGKLVKPYLVEIDENEQSKLLAAVDEATSDLMRLILHNKAFQSLEADWRALYFLIRKVETDVDLKIYVLNISKDEIINDLKSTKSLADSSLYKWIIRDTIETPGGTPWAAIGGDFSFDLNIEDVAALIRLEQLAKAADAPFISHITPQVLGVSSLAGNSHPENWNVSGDSNEGKLWTTLRSLPESSYLGLAIPRFLIRLPYGRKTEPVENFSFEEFSDAPVHNDYLWANPCFACLLLLANSFRANGWDLAPLIQDIEGLPVHIYHEGTETIMQPCTEIALTVNGCDKIIEQGLMPLISFKNTDRIRLARLQSVASPLTSLKGKWSD